jgi:hypothetical protein
MRTQIKFARLIATILIFLTVVTCIVFAIPLKECTEQTVETYLETEMRSETYVVKEPYIEKELRTKSVVFFDGYETVVPNGVDVPFSIDKPNALVVGEFNCSISGGFYVYSSTNRIIYEMLGSQGAFQISLPPGNYKARFRENVVWGEQVYMHVAMEWTEVEEVTKYTETLQERQVPVQSEKQRIITTTEKKSIWQLIFGD